MSVHMTTFSGALSARRGMKLKQVTLFTAVPHNPMPDTEVKAGKGRRGRKPWVLVGLELTQTSICLAGLQRAF